MMLFARADGRQQKASAVGNMSTSPQTPIARFEGAQRQRPIILLVEDESMVREVTRQVLEHAGYEVLESAGAKEALRLAAEHRGRIHLLLSDVVMPGMNGFDLAHRIERMQPHLTTVFMSGYTQAATLRQSVQEPCRMYLRKPFTIDLLLRSIDKALSRSPAASMPNSGTTDLSAETRD
jgi:two-component system, cell cycle sensor histidine kinase and response regulator CckA